MWACVVLSCCKSASIWEGEGLLSCGSSPHTDWVWVVWQQPCRTPSPSSRACRCLPVAHGWVGGVEREELGGGKEKKKSRLPPSRPTTKDQPYPGGQRGGAFALCLLDVRALAGLRDRVWRGHKQRHGKQEREGHRGKAKVGCSMSGGMSAPPPALTWPRVCWAAGPEAQRVALAARWQAPLRSSPSQQQLDGRLERWMNALSGRGDTAALPLPPIYLYM